MHQPTTKCWTNGNAKGWIGKAAFVVVALLVLMMAGMIFYGVSSSYQAEKRLHATNLATAVVTEFIQREKRWPESWNDLRDVSVASVPSMYSWPQDVSSVKDLVIIDFDADMHRVARQESHTFDQIKPNGPCYPYHDYGFVEALIAAVRQCTEEK